ncbi:Protein of uncharacterised function (DUF328) [Pantoea agglomerans]|uniref:Protein of uncharacterized function (DUF328) n=1 Tax=Enterobacter agglomerans TaxID=549 RepID=A0A379ALQ8_ENTAG|nr:Protein of uncharacterised function (DUF328) [Pantoea agglomerans]
MLMVISPAKTLDYESPLATTRFTQPALLEKSQQLIEIARELSPASIASLMGISDKLAHLNAERFNSWQPDFSPKNARQAILAFKGDVYTGLQAETFSDQDFDFAQQHLAYVIRPVWRTASTRFNAALPVWRWAFAWRIRRAKISTPSGAISSLKR